MGKASRWFKGLLGFKKDKETVDKREKKRWSFGKPTKESSSPVAVAVASHDTNPYMRSYMTENEQNKHAIAVAAATAAAADAAVAAAQAAVAVVKLTSHGRERWAAVKIQTVFRAHLARKALRALKGLVKLQALVRGFLVRRRTVATLYSMQALVRAQAAVRSQRARRSFKDRHRKPTERYDHETRSEIHSKRLSTSYESTTNSYDYESPKIVEIDTYKTHARSRRIHTCQTDSSEESRLYHNMSSPNPARNFQDCEWGFVGGDQEYKCSNTTQSTPRFGRTNNGSATPAKTVCGDSFFRSYYSNHPSYMANTQSFRAKQRSHSAPKQRPEVGAKKRLSLIEIMASRSSLSGVRMQRSCSKAQQVINEL